MYRRPMFWLRRLKHTSAVGAKDGQVELVWAPVPGAVRYEVGVAASEEGPMTVLDPNATSPYVFTGLGAGKRTVGVRAYMGRPRPASRRHPRWSWFKGLFRAER